MAEVVPDIDNILREWAPVQDLLNKIPTKAQSGIFSYEICLTCVDILPEYIAVGTNIGIVYWYDRKKKDLQKLRCENPNGRVTTVKIISTVDYMVACGNNEGQISIFQIPKTHPDSLPEILKPKPKQVERYTVAELHTSAITSLEWSKNGMKLFSGDMNGLVVLTEIDFYMHLSKSVEILNEAYEVVQLNYCQQTLLVSTVYRSIVCKKEDKWKVCQVGKKDRKTLGKLGAIFWQNSLKPKDLSIYCTRPGLRIWISDLEGIVQKTLLFKDLINKECYEVPLINPITGYAKKLKPLKEATFGVLLPFSENLLVTYSSEVIYVLDPVNLLVIATISHLRRILSVAVHKEEIFILEGERSLVRISFKPETQLNEIITTSTIPQASTFLPLTVSLKDFTNKIQTSSIISVLPPLFENTNTDFNIHTDSTSVINAEEAFELPPVKKLPQNTKLQLKLAERDTNTGLECRVNRNGIENKKWEQFDKISEEEFDDHILFKHRRRKKRQNINASANEMQTSVTSVTSVNSLSSTSSDERDPTLNSNSNSNININKPCLLNISTIDTLMPDLRSPDSILHDIENKEKILADILQLDKIKFSSFENDTFKKQKQKQNQFNVDVDDDIKTKEEEIFQSEQQQQKQQQQEDVIKMKKDKEEEDIIMPSNYFPETNNGVVEKQPQMPTMSYGPPSGSSNPNSIDPPACLAVPNIWRLQEITLNNQDANETSDNSLCDWEII